MPNRVSSQARGARHVLCAAAVVIGASALAQAPPHDTPSRQLAALTERAWAFRLEEDPLLATAVGEHRYDGRLPSLSAQDLARRERFWQEMRARLAAIDAERLDGQDRISHEIFRAAVEDALASHRFGEYRQPLNADSGFHTELADLPSSVPLGTVAEYESYVARLRAMPVYVAQQIELLRRGLRDGFTVPRVALEGYETSIATHVVDDPETSIFFGPFRRFPRTFPEEVCRRLAAEGRAAVVEGPLPAFRSFLEFMRREYVPGARRTIAASDLPDGRAYYAHLVRRSTTLPLTPDEVHERGLAEVARIRAEMDGVLKKLRWEKGFPAFLDFLRTDPRFYARTPEQLLEKAAHIAKRMDGKLPSLFGRLPRQPYGVEPVPEHLAPKYTGGRYVPAPRDGTRAGTYWVNTYRLESRPLYFLEALTFHEAVPGHHLQIALSREVEGLPEWRRYADNDAYGEGWALYAERLGLEAGFYADPYSDFGRLTYEMWRACRLVVDTGLHARGWSRQQAIDFLASRTALSLHECTTETDRYISWPGQALAYKIGELEIRALRARAEEVLGSRFDRRAFHDTVLGSGPVPLGTLRRLVEEWIAREKRAAVR